MERLYLLQELTYFLKLTMNFQKAISTQNEWIVSLPFLIKQYIIFNCNSKSICILFKEEMSITKIVFNYSMKYLVSSLIIIIFYFIYSIVYKEYRRKYQTVNSTLRLLPYNKEDNKNSIELNNKI